jgi:membrane fusion protein, adhesin transport system
MSKDMKFASSLTEAWMSKSHRSLCALSLVLVALFFGLIYWSSVMELEVLTKGSGSIIPSEATYTVDNLEGGILVELNVTEGQSIKKGDAILKIDNGSFIAALKENEKSQILYTLKLARLNAEENATPLKLPVTQASYKQLKQSEENYFNARQKEYQEQVTGYSNLLDNAYKSFYENVSAITRLQAEMNLKKLSYSPELQKKAPEAVKFDTAYYALRKSTLSKEESRLKQALDLLNIEYKKKVELEKDGAVSEVELLHLKRTLIDTKGSLERLQENFLQKVASELKERRSSRLTQRDSLTRISDSLNEYKKKWHSEINKEILNSQSQLSLLKDKYHALKDKVDRSVIYSPVDGVINKVHSRNIGSSIQPGQDIVEIVPSSQKMIIEASINPQDIAFVHTGQKAIIKVTAYDFSIYGGINGTVTFVSPDTHIDPQGVPFYKIRIQSERNYLGKKKKNVIIPGMQVEVDLINGKRTLLEYILKPLKRGSETALTEL